MPVRPEPWPAGVPAWVDLMVPDLHAAREFYALLFGWTFLEESQRTLSGGDGLDGDGDGNGDPTTELVYLTALARGSAAAGIGSMPGDTRPPRWTTYLATPDVEQAVEQARTAGATVLVPPDTADGAGRFAVLADPTGAVVGLWQSGTHTGAEVTDEPGAVTWNEVLTDDVPTAMAFYAEVFGHTHTDMSAPGFTYASFSVDGRLAGGIGALDGTIGGQPDPHWLVYFAVEDVGAAVQVVQDHGGGVVRPAWDSPFGRIALVAGPFGEPFAVMTGADPDADEPMASGEG